MQEDNNYNIGIQKLIYKKGTGNYTTLIRTFHFQSMGNRINIYFFITRNECDCAR